MLTNMKDILQSGKVVYQFNINNLEWIRYILEECNNQNKPVILGVSMSAGKYLGGYKNVYDMVINLLDSLNIEIPVSIHLDHASSKEECYKAIDAGFTSVMLDYSSHSLEENIKETNELIKYAKSKDILVEGEIGPIEEGMNASLNDCIKYVNETEVDILAPSIGNLHGIYHGEIKLDFELLKSIKERVKKPLVLHGASGLNDELLKEAIKNGVNKININTDLQIAWFKGLKEGIKNNPDTYDPRKVISYGENNLKQCIKDKLTLI